MSPEELVEEMLLLNKDGRARLVRLMMARPTLQRAIASYKPAPVASDSYVAPPSEADYLIIWDGGSRGNPGEGYGSYRLVAGRSGKSRVETLTFEGRRTNNEAEYLTLISALETLLAKLVERGREPKQITLDMRGDSLLVVNQVNGRWKAKDERMAGYRDRVRALLDRFGETRLSHHDRKKSVAALGH